MAYLSTVKVIDTCYHLSGHVFCHMGHSVLGIKSRPKQLNLNFERILFWIFFCISKFKKNRSIFATKFL